MLLHYSGAKALVETVMPDRPNPIPNVSPFGSFDSNTGMTQFYDFEERVVIMKMPDTGESVPYVVSHEFQSIDSWLTGCSLMLTALFLVTQLRKRSLFRILSRP